PLIVAARIDAIGCLGIAARDRHREGGFGVGIRAIIRERFDSHRSDSRPEEHGGCEQRPHDCTLSACTLASRGSESVDRRRTRWDYGSTLKRRGDTRHKPEAFPTPHSVVAIGPRTCRNRNVTATPGSGAAL